MLKFALSLVSQDNDYQRAQAAAGKETALRRSKPGDEFSLPARKEEAGPVTYVAVLGKAVLQSWDPRPPVQKRKSSDQITIAEKRP
jgi:hypothetical protein